MQINKQLNHRFSDGVGYILETTRFECLCNYTLYKGIIKTDNIGMNVHIGNINDDITLSVHISLWLEEFKGFKYLCYEPSSVVVDHRMINKWLDYHFKGIERTDMINYHHIIHEQHKRAQKA